VLRPSQSLDVLEARCGATSILLWSLPDMLQSYLPIYEVAVDLGKLRYRAELSRQSGIFTSKISPEEQEVFRALVERVERVCLENDLTQTSDFAKRILGRSLPETYGDEFAELNHLDDALRGELEKEAVYRVPPYRKMYFGNPHLFGSKVAAAFPSCARDIQRAGDCFALGQEDGCVHHLMLVLERGLNALAINLQIPYQRTNWQPIISQVGAKLKATSRDDPHRDFFLEINAQFGFLKDAYRNHSEHAHDDLYDMEKALSILNHVRHFMQQMADGGLTEE
jgi:hypothetical protein